jgi:hypothetical protein
MKLFVDRHIMRVMNVISAVVMYASLRIYDFSVSYRATHRFRIELSKHVSYPMVPRRRGRGAL